jgi:hypothetical protein
MKSGIVACVIFHVSLFMFFSCGTIQRSGKPSATGKAGEMLIVMNKGLWEGQPGEVVKGVFQQPEPMFLQEEPMFDLVQIDHANFVKLFETHRHIFIVEVGPEHPKATMEVSRDIWSYPQMVIRVKAPDDSTFRLVIERNSEAFVGHYLAMERERLINAYGRMENLAARNAVNKMFGITMTIPEGYYVATEGEQFIWLRRTGTRDDFDLGVLIASMPYKDPAIDFNPSVIWARRDSLTKKYIPGQFDGSFMTTYPELEPQAREISLNGKYAMELRSLWRVEGDYMGGPFVTYAMVDEETNRLFIFDGFVYAPNFDKRDYIRQVMAVIYSTTFPGSENQLTSSEQ